MSLGFLTPTLQRPMPCFTYPPQHAIQCVRAEVQSEVLVVAVEHLRQMRLLDSDGLVTVRLDPRRHLAHKALACFDARCAADGDRAATCLRQVVGKAKEGEGAGLVSRVALDHLATGCR